MIRGLGWIPDPEPSDEERARHVERVGALRVAAPTEPFTREPWILDQLDSEACTMHEAVEALYALTGFLGSPWPGWWLARHADLLPGQRDVANVGVSTYAALRTMEQHGIPPWDVWHPGMDRFSYSAAPPALARTEGQRHRLRVTPIWTDPEESVRAALSSGLPCGIVVEVDPAFEAATGGRVPPESGRSRGKHMLTLWPFRTPEEADGEPLLVNSWGRSWAINGTARVSWDRIRSAPFLCFSELAT